MDTSGGNADPSTANPSTSLGNEQTNTNNNPENPARNDTNGASNSQPSTGHAPAPGGKLAGSTRQPRVIIKAADMPQDMQRKAINLALTALDRFELERDMAYFLKREFDERFQPSWHCIVGRHFGSFVTHDGSGFLYFYIDKTAILLFRSGS